MATIVLALFLAGCPLLCWTAASAVQNLSSVMDASGHCVCTVILPDDTFPLRRIELLETSARNLTLRVQREMEKLQEYGQRLAWHEAKLQNASRRLRWLETGDLTPTELDFQELRKEIGEMESFVGHLRSSLNGSDTTVEVVHRELFVTFCRPTNYILPFVNVRGKSLIDRRWDCPLIYLLRRTQKARACELLDAPQWRGEPKEDYVILAPRRWDRRSHKRSFACWKPQ